MQKALPVIASIALVLGIGLLVYGYGGGIPMRCSGGVRVGGTVRGQTCVQVISDQAVMATGAMLVAVSAIALRRR